MRQFYYKLKYIANRMDKNISVYHCSFQAYVDTASVFIKFPCLFFLEWKTSNNQKCIEGKNRPTAVNTQINFQETLQLTTEMIFDNSTRQFLKKETLLNINLISKSRQDQVKLVGRVSLDLAELANRNTFQELKTYRLAYCSVDGEITFSAIMKTSKPTDLRPEDLDRSSYNEFRSFYSCRNQKDPKKERMGEYDQQTSVEFAVKKPNQNAIDQPQDRRNKNFNQTFFIMPSSPRNNSFNRTNELPKINRDRSIQVDTVTTMPRGRDVKGNIGSRENDLWEREKNRFRGEIDGNKEKIQELEKRIIQLCVNLQDSKRQVELTEKQNKEKEALIKQLKNTVTVEQPRAEAQYRQLEQKYDKLYQERRDQEKKSRITEETLKRQLALSNASCDNLRKETEELRKIWTEKKEYYEDKLKHSQYLIKEKQAKINEVNAKIEEISKYKYQYELMKELNEEKESKIKLVEKDLVKLSKELEEIKKDNLGEENYKLKLNYNQSLKNIEDLTLKLNKWEEEVGRYKENYIKISTAYEIQTKNYDNNKEKYNQLENNFFRTQKETIESKNTIQNLKKQQEELQQKYSEAYNNSNNLNVYLEASRKKNEELQKENQELKQQRNLLKETIDKNKVEEDIRKSENQNEIKRIQTSFNNSLQLKQKVYNAQKKDLESQIASLKALLAGKESEYQQSKETFDFQKSSLTQEISIKEQELKKKQTTIQRLNQIIADKQDLIKMYKEESESLKETNQQLIQSMTRMKEKERELTETISVLEEESQKIMAIAQLKEEIEKELQKSRQETQSIRKEKQELTHRLDVLNQSYARFQRQKHELQMVIQEQRTKVEETKQILDEKGIELQQKDHQLQSTLLILEETKSEFMRYQEETNERLQESDKMKGIIAEINQRYEEHLRMEEKYVEEIKNVRIEKEEIEVLMNKNINEIMGHNNTLENRVQELESQLEKMEQLIRSLEEEKKQLEQIILQTKTNALEVNSKTIEYESKVSDLQEELKNQQVIGQEKDNIIASLKGQLSQIQCSQQQNQCKLDEISSVVSQKEGQIQSLNEKLSEYEQALTQKSDKIVLLEQSITDLQGELSHLRQEMALKQESPYNEQIICTGGTVQEQHKISAREEELQQLLFESDRKNQNLEARVTDLLFQVDQLQKKRGIEQAQPSQVLYSNFPEFQRQELNKIIEEQKEQIQRLESQLKKGTEASILQQRIVQLQNHIVELEASFKIQIEKILAEQQISRDQNGNLEVINEENSEDQILYRSQRSLVNSLSRIKSSFDGVELVELRQKVHGLQEEKNKMEEEFGLMEEEKFNLLSTINQKDIEIQELVQGKLHLSNEIQELQSLNDSLQSKIKQLFSEIDHLKSQLAFGESINFPNNDQTVTRSEAFIKESRIVQNKDIEIENLKAELQKQRGKVEELEWYIKDLEMQLETVTQNLNHLNASTMNSVLIGQEKTGLQEERQRDGDVGYNKERLLQNLKKNQELKELSHNLIRVLKQREKDAKQQEKLFRDIRSSREKVDQLSQTRLETIKNAIGKLIKEFQIIKVYILKAEGSQLQREVEVSSEGKDGKPIIKNVLSIEQGLKEIVLQRQ